MNTRRSWIVFAGAVFAYVVGVTQRTSFGVAGVEATHRFDVSAAPLGQPPRMIFRLTRPGAADAYTVRVLRAGD